MMERKLLNLNWLVLVVVAGVILAGCGGGLSGTYKAKGGLGEGFLSLEFKSGNQVFANVMGNTVEGTYKIEGDKVIVYVNGKNMAFTLAKDGSLADGPMGATLVKMDK